MRILKNKYFWLGLPIAILALALFFSDMTRRYVFYGLPVGAGVAAKLACSGVYVAGRSPADVIQRDLEPFNYPILKYARYDFDRDKQTASASLFGLMTRTALYRKGIGCTLMVAATPEELLHQAKGVAPPPMTRRPAPWPAGDAAGNTRDIPGIDWQKLDRAVDGAFADSSEHQTIDTRAIIVVYDGRIVAEKYAPGFDRNSRFLSWSAAKSVTSALIGTLVDDGKLALDRPAPVAEWAAPDDPRHDITLNHLLTMTSGLAFSEPYIPGNDSTTMLFNRPRLGDYAAAKPLAHAPGAFWYYSSGTTNLLARILFDQTGGSLKAAQDYARERLFAPLGMTSAVFEVDEGGRFIGSSYLYATARDWARFGLLYLNRGVINGRRVLSEDWIDYSRTPTPQAPQGKYGAQFWLNAGHPTRDEGLMLPDCPQDMYLANGHNNQHIAVIPSKKAVLVRLGWTTRGAKFDLNRHFSEILKALPDDPPSPAPDVAAPDA